MRALIGGILLIAGGPLAAQQPDTTELARLRQQIEAITRELELLKLGSEVLARADTAQLGLGPAASKVYRVGQGVSIGGYGEALYERFATIRQDNVASGRADQLDALRAVVYVGYKFNDRLLFNSEVEFEHGSTGNGGSVSLEFAYLDWRLAPAFGVRGGLLLIPMGFLNELHEPPAFLGSTRPLSEQLIIPTTWRENGLGVFGETPWFSYRLYLVNALDAVGGGSSSAAGFSSTGLRGGRQNGARALAEEMAGVGRVDFTRVLGLTVGLSGYLGSAGQNRTLPGDTVRLGARTAIVEAHGQYQRSGLDLRGLFTAAWVRDAGAINLLKGLGGSATVPSRLWGWYLQAGFDVLRFAATGQQLVPFLRVERVQTQDRVPDGFTGDPATDRNVYVAGLAWRPIPQVALKTDLQIHHNGAQSGVDQLNLNLSYLF